MNTKRCARCHNEYPANDDYFSTIKARGVLRLHSYCRKCINEYAAERHRINSEKINIRRRELYAINPEPQRAASRKYSRDNLTKKLEYNRKYVDQNRDRVTENNRIYYLNNREDFINRAKIYRRQNADYMRRKSREYYMTNKEAMNKYSCDYKKARSKVDVMFKITLIVRQSTRRAVKAVLGKMSGESSLKYCDYTISDFKNHMESLFQPGMTWDNYGKWHVDHIRPVSSFKYDSYDHPEFKKCWELSNLQPLWAIDNLKKGAKIL